MLAVHGAHRRCVAPFICRAASSLQASASSESSALLTPPLSKSQPRKPNATVSSGGASSNTTSAGATSKPRPTSNKPRRRPDISLEKPRKWHRPVALGVLPAYDEALKYIREDAAALRVELAQLREQIQAYQALPEHDPMELESMLKRAEMLEIQSEINLPSVRWYFANGMADMKKPVYRHLAEQKWRTRGGLDLLMERLHQMHVIPDILPSFHPSFDLRVTFPERPPQSTYLRTRIRRRHMPVEPGVFLLPEQTRRPPRLYTTVFHPDERLYTMILVDADVPDTESQGFTTYLHWMIPNIPLSATSESPLHISSHTHYIPPHPQRGSPYHRYCLFLLPNPEPRTKVSIPAISEAGRAGFSLRDLSAKYGFDGSNGGGAHMWREVWNETVSDIYRDTLKLPEPVFGRPPRQDRYAEANSTPRY